jgi:hypothetical protein
VIWTCFINNDEGFALTDYERTFPALPNLVECTSALLQRSVIIHLPVGQMKRSGMITNDHVDSRVCRQVHLFNIRSPSGGKVPGKVRKVCVPTDCHPLQTVRWLGSSETNQIEALADRAQGNSIYSEDTCSCMRGHTQFYWVKQCST